MPGCTASVMSLVVQVVPTFPLPGPAATGVQFCTLPMVVFVGLQVVSTQPLLAVADEGVHEATSVGPVVTVRQLT